MDDDDLDGLDALLNDAAKLCTTTLDDKPTKPEKQRYRVKTSQKPSSTTSEAKPSHTGVDIDTDIDDILNDDLGSR